MALANIAKRGVPVRLNASGGVSPAVKLLLSAGRVAGASGVSALLLAVTGVITARSLGPSGRGSIVLVSTGATYLMLVTSLGIPISGRVMLGRLQQRQIFSHYLGLSLILLVGQVLLTAILVPIVLARSGVAATPSDDVLVGAYGGGLMAAYLLVHGLFGLGLNEQAAFVQMGGALMQVVAVAALAYFGVADPWPYLGAFLVATIGQVVVSLTVLAKAGFSMKPNFGMTVALELARKGLPAIGLTLGQSATLRIDRILIGLLLTASSVGIYSVAATGTELVWLVPTALSQILFHRFASKSVDFAMATQARLMSLAIALVSASAMFVLAPLAIDFLVGPRFAGAVLPFRILLIGAVFLASYQLDAYALAAQGRIGRAASAAVIGFATVFAVDLLTIPAYGIVGAAWASVIAYGLMAVIVRVMVRRLNLPQARGAHE